MSKSLAGIKRNSFFAVPVSRFAKRKLMENEELLIDSLRKDLQVDLHTKVSFEEIKEKLYSHINHLISDHFEELIGFLYKIDVNEVRLKKMLKDNSDSMAAKIIADLIIERQLQKIKTRQELKATNDKEKSEEEKW
jgi:hypothetical protein